MRIIFTTIFLAPGHVLDRYIAIVRSTDAESETDWWHRQF